MRYDKEVAWKFFGDQEKARQYISQARTVAGEIFSANVNELEQVTRRVQLAEGVWCQVKQIPGQVIIEIHATSEETQNLEQCCQGFVVKDGGAQGQFCWNDAQDKWRWKKGNKCVGGNVVWHNDVSALSFDAKTRYTAEDLSPSLYKNGKLLWQAPKTVIGACQTENFVVAILGEKYSPLELWFTEIGKSDWQQGTLSGEKLSNAELEILQPVLFNKLGTTGVSTVRDPTTVVPYDYDYSDDYDFGWYDYKYIYKNYTITLTESIDGISGSGALTPGSSGTGDTNSSGTYGRTNDPFDSDSSCYNRALYNQTQSYAQNIYADGTVDTVPATMDLGTLGACNCGECALFSPWLCLHCKSDWAWLAYAMITGSPGETNRSGIGGHGEVGELVYCCTEYSWCGMCGSNYATRCPGGKAAHVLVEIQYLNLDKVGTEKTNSSSSSSGATFASNSTQEATDVRKITLRRDFDGNAEVTAEIELTAAEVIKNNDYSQSSENISMTEVTSEVDSCIAGPYNQTPFLKCDDSPIAPFYLSWDMSWTNTTVTENTYNSATSSNTKRKELIKVTFCIGETEIIVLDLNKDYSKVDFCNSSNVTGGTSTYSRNCAGVTSSSNIPTNSFSGSSGSDITNTGSAAIRKILAYDLRCAAILYIDRVYAPVATNTINDCSIAPAVTQIKLLLPNQEEHVLVTDADTSITSLGPRLPTLSNYSNSSSSPVSSSCHSYMGTYTEYTWSESDINYYEWVLRRFVEEDYATLYFPGISCQAYSPRVKLFSGNELPEPVVFCCNQDVFGKWMLSTKVTTTQNEYVYSYLEAAENNDPLTVAEFSSGTYFPHISVVGR